MPDVDSVSGWAIGPRIQFGSSVYENFGFGKATLQPIGYKEKEKTMISVSV
jgi:hypothetical protein